jgi:hypothetical protein
MEKRRQNAGSRMLAMIVRAFCGKVWFGLIVSSRSYSRYRAAFDLK